MSACHPAAIILLSTFQGARFLEEQLNSLRMQTHENWVLLIRDDGSTDSTLDIIFHYCEIDSRIIHIQDKLGNIKTKNSFSKLMQIAMMRHEEFILFCDQDDVWLPTKLADTIALLLDMKNRHGANTPLLVHSDLYIADEKLDIKYPSFLSYENLNRNSKFPLKTLLINNYVTGCTVGLNKSLLTIAYPIPDNARMHDWWCALCAASMGKIGWIPKPTLYYRQHSNNQVGSAGFYRKCRDFIYLKHSLAKKRQNFYVLFLQGKALLERICQDNPHFALVQEFSDLNTLSWIKRCWAAIQIRLKPASKLRVIIFWFMLITIQKGR